MLEESIAALTKLFFTSEFAIYMLAMITNIFYSRQKVRDFTKMNQTYCAESSLSSG